MVYTKDAAGSRFVMAVMIDGVAQKERANGTVEIPFGSEFSIRLFNKNKRRAVVKLFIDGENVSGEGFVIAPNKAETIKRSVDTDASFKFVSLDSSAAIEFGKNGPNTDKEKGLIEARFYLEKEAPTPPVVEHHYHHYDYVPYRPYRTYPRLPDTHYIWNTWYNDSTATCKPESNIKSRSLQRDSFKALSNTPINNNSLSFNSSCGLVAMSGGDGGSSGMEAVSYQLMGLVDDSAPNRQLQDGCVVEGNSTGQRFSSVYLDYDASSYTTLKLFLQGYNPEEAKPDNRVIRIKPKLDVVEPSVSEAEIEARRAEEEEARLRKILAEAKAKKLREELAELGVEY